jgi:hypothetical protein
VRYIILFLAAIVTLSCESSQGLQQDIGDASVTESKEDVSGCEFVTRVTATVDLQEFDNNREAAMESLLDRLRNRALHMRCDTVYLITVKESTTFLQAIGEGYRCESASITGGPMGGSLP